MLGYKMSAKKIRGVEVKKHKMEIAALTLLLGVLCYAYYDSNIKVASEQSIVLNNELFSTEEVNSKEEITVDMIEDSYVEQEKNDSEEVTNDYEVDVNESSIYSMNLAVEVEDDILYNEIISNQVVNYALNFVGKPYVYGGNSLTNGTDCSGFTKLIFANYDISLPRSAISQSYSGKSVGLSNIMPGDLVFSGYGGTIGHVAIYIGNNKIVHALNENVGIVVTDLHIMPILDVRRVA